MTLTTLNWSQTDYQPTGYLAPTDAQVIDALIANAGSMLTKWRVISYLASNYIEFGGPIGSPAESHRILVGINPGAGYCNPDVSGTGVWAGYSTRGGTLGTWNSASPYGTTNYFSGYWKVSATAIVESFYFIESEETLIIVFRDDSLDRYYCAGFGGLFDPLTGDTEPDGRVYGYFTSGSTYISGTFYGAPDGFLGHHTSSGSPHFGVFRPYSPAVFDPVKPHGQFVIDTSQTLVMSNNDEIFASRTYYTNQAPRYCCGALRQMYVSQDRGNRTVTSEGFVFSPSSAGADAILFGNE